MDSINEKLLTSTLDLFSTKGVVNTTIKDIYNSVGITEKEFREIYPTKKDIIYNLYSIGKNDMFKFVYGEILEIDKYKNFMRKVFHQSVIWGLNNRTMFNFMNQIQLHPYSWTDVSDEKIYPTINEKIVSRTKKAINNNTIKDLPIDFIIHFMSGMLTSCVSYILSLNTIVEEEYEYLIEPMFQSCWDAIKKH